MNNVTVLLYPGSLAYNCSMSMQLSLWKAEWKWILFNCSCLIWFIVSKAVTFILFWPYIGSKSPKTSIINFLMFSNMCFVCWCITTVNNIHLHSWIIVCTSVNWSYLIQSMHILSINLSFVLFRIAEFYINAQYWLYYWLEPRLKFRFPIPSSGRWTDERDIYSVLLLCKSVTWLWRMLHKVYRGHSRVRVA